MRFPSGFGVWPRTAAMATVLTFTCKALIYAQDPPAWSSVPGAPAGVTAFVGVNVVPMDAERVLSNQTVLIEQGRIMALGPVKQVKIPAGAVTIDGQNKYLIPGLADMHFHLTNGAAGGIESVLRESERRLLLSAANGVTTVRSVDAGRGDRSSSFRLQLRARSMAGESWGPWLYTSGRWRKAHGDTAVSMAAQVAEYKAEGFDFLKVHAESPATMDSLGTIARQVGIPLLGHVPPGISFEKAIAAGYTSIEHLTGYLGQGLPLPDTIRIRAMADATKRAGVWNCPTLAVYGILNFDQGQPGLAQRSGQLIKALQDEGAGLLLGVDAIWLPAEGLLQPGFGAHVELQALVASGLTPYQALVAATRNPARYFGMSTVTGTITVGKRADLVLLRGNPLKDIRQTTRPAGVMIGGRWLARAELDQRLAALASPPSEQQATLDWYDIYWPNVMAQASRMFERIVYKTVPSNPLMGMADSLLWFDGIPLADGQREQFQRLETTVHRAQRRALVDSLVAARVDSIIGYPRLIQLLARQLGTFRAGMTPEQQVILDPKARAWFQPYPRPWYTVAVPDIPP